jgi:hypothetical protein
MAGKDKYDPYREALVIETTTLWPTECTGLDASEKARIEAALHANPQPCGGLEYVRLHTGFCRQITVTPDDLQRVRGGQ